MLFFAWLYGVQNSQRPMLPDDMSQEDRIRVSKYFDLAAEMPERVAEMRKKLHAWYQQVDAKLLQPKPNGPMPWRPVE